MMKVFTLLAALFAANVAYANERYEEYYYPKVTSAEEFTRVIRQSPPAGKSVRVDFVTNLTVAQLQAPESPRFVFFAKGDDCLLYTSPSPRDLSTSRMPSSA